MRNSVGGEEHPKVKIYMFTQNQGKDITAELHGEPSSPVESESVAFPVAKKSLG